MESMDQHWLHSNRKQLVKTTGHLLDMRRALLLANDHSKLIRSFDPNCEAVDQNIQALIDGVNETISLCAIAKENIDKQIEDPHAVTSPIFGGNMQTTLTPFQRMLQREGTVFPSSLPTHETKVERRLPKIMTFTIKRKAKRPNRSVNIKEGRIPL